MARTSRWVSVLVVAVALGAAGAASAEPVASFLRSLPQNTLRDAVAPPLEGAREDGLPVRYLLAKAREGVLKKVPAPRLGRVLQQLADHLRRARTLTRRLPFRTPALQEGIAQALASGLSEPLVRQAMATAMVYPQTRSAFGVRRAVIMVTDLVNAGASPTDGVVVLSAVLARYPGGLPVDRVLRGLRWYVRITRRPWSQAVADVVAELGRSATFEAVVRDLARRHAPK